MSTRGAVVLSRLGLVGGALCAVWLGFARTADGGVGLGREAVDSGSAGSGAPWSGAGSADSEAGAVTGGCLAPDADGNGAVDLEDQRALVGCMSTSPYSVSRCRVFDADDDGRVRLNDWAGFQVLFTGSGVPARTISGRVFDHSGVAGGRGVPGLGLFYRGNLESGSLVTDEEGYYSLTVPNGWCGSIRPLHGSLRLQPEGVVDVPVTADLVRNFTAPLRLVRISGRAFRGDGVTPATGRLMWVRFYDGAGRFLRTIEIVDGVYDGWLYSFEGGDVAGTAVVGGVDVRFATRRAPYSVGPLSRQGPDFEVFYDLYVSPGGQLRDVTGGRR